MWRIILAHPSYIGLNFDCLNKTFVTLAIGIRLIIYLAINRQHVILRQTCLFVFAKIDRRNKRSLWRIGWVYGKMVNYALVGSVDLNFFGNSEFKLSNCITESMIRMISFRSYNEFARRFRSSSFSDHTRPLTWAYSGRSADEQNMQCLGEWIT